MHVEFLFKKLLFLRAPETRNFRVPASALAIEIGYIYFRVSGAFYTLISLKQRFMDLPLYTMSLDLPREPGDRLGGREIADDADLFALSRGARRPDYGRMRGESRAALLGRPDWDESSTSALANPPFLDELTSPPAS